MVCEAGVVDRAEECVRGDPDGKVKTVIDAVPCFGVAVVVLCKTVKFVVEHATKRIPSSRRDLHTLIVMDDERFDVGRQDRCMRAVGALSMTPETLHSGVVMAGGYEDGIFALALQR